MKKFMKTCGITAVIILLAGLCTVVIGGCGGGIKDLAQQAINGELSFGEDDLKEWLGDWGGKWVWNAEWNTYDINVNDIFDHDFPIIKDGEEITLAEGTEGVTNLDIELGGCEAKLTVSPDDDFHIQAFSVPIFQSYVSGDTLYIKGVKSGKLNDNLTMVVELQIPEGYYFDQVSLSLGAGDFTIDKLAAGELNMEVGAGRVQIASLEADRIKCQLGAGQVTFKDALAEKADFEIGVGELVYTGNITGDMSAECAMGNMELHVKGSRETDHNYKLECVAGNMTVGDSNYAGLASEKDINNGADSTYQLECAMGNMTVTFE